MTSYPSLFTPQSFAALLVGLLLSAFLADRARRLPIGSRSVLFGAHQFFIHPIFVFLGWWKLYGFPRDPRLWVAFVVHDLGYWGRGDMDGAEGEAHVEWGAGLMERWFGREWADLCRYHSRYWANQHGVKPSRLCFADKMALVVTPVWMHVLLTRLSGEIVEYRALRQVGGKYYDEAARYGRGRSDFEMYANMKNYLRDWIKEHIGGAEDTWTARRGNA